MDDEPTIRIDSDGKRYKDFPFENVIARVRQLILEGHRCYQKFSCEKCGQRLGIDRPNTFYERGNCDKCGHITNIRERGCNYLLISKIGPGSSKT